MRTIGTRSMRNCLAAGALILAACGDGATAPGTNPEIINTADNFQYQVSNIQQYSGTQTYTWQNSGTTATVNQSTSIGAGSATLVLKDANGVQVFSRSLADNGTFTSTAGVAGAWTVSVVYSSASATVNFRLDKAN